LEVDGAGADEQQQINLASMQRSVPTIPHVPSQPLKQWIEVGQTKIRLIQTLIDDLGVKLVESRCKISQRILEASEIGRLRHGLARRKFDRRS